MVNGRERRLRGLSVGVLFAVGCGLGACAPKDVPLTPYKRNYNNNTKPTGENKPRANIGAFDMVAFAHLKLSGLVTIFQQSLEEKVLPLDTNCQKIEVVEAPAQRTIKISTEITDANRAKCAPHFSELGVEVKLKASEIFDIYYDLTTQPRSVAKIFYGANWFKLEMRSPKRPVGSPGVNRLLKVVDPVRIEIVREAANTYRFDMLSVGGDVTQPMPENLGTVTLKYHADGKLVAEPGLADGKLLLYIKSFSHDLQGSVYYADMEMASAEEKTKRVSASATIPLVTGKACSLLEGSLNVTSNAPAGGKLTNALVHLTTEGVFQKERKVVDLSESCRIEGYNRQLTPFYYHFYKK